ncbi:MAG: N-acetyltransferase, partial [Ottowia sp.]|nr:N-acetyltransferase [Ottowia sp.]
NEGQGLGTELARFALQDIRAGGERVKPSCPFVADYMDRHPDTADLRAS